MILGGDLYYKKDPLQNTVTYLVTMRLSLKVGRGRGTWDAGTRGRGDAGTWGRGDAGTRGRGDTGRRGRGDARTSELGDARGFEDVINRLRNKKIAY